MPRAERVWAIVVGGGSGQRFGRPKQYEVVGGRRIIDHARLTAATCCDGVVVVVPPEDAEAEGAVAGGSTRSDSVRAGLAQVPADATIVCVHDAARPLASAELFRRVIEAVELGADGAIPGVSVTDTIKVIDQAGAVVSTPERSSLVAVQTPQAFRAGILRSAHASGDAATDDAALVERAGGRVVVVDGDVANRKVTEPDDLDWVRQRLERSAGART